MKNIWVCCLIIFFAAAGLAVAQSEDSDWDINTIFNEAPEEGKEKAAAASEKTEKDKAPVSEKPATSGTKTTNTVSNLLRRKGFTFSASISMLGGGTMGWLETPWNWDEDYGTWDELDATAGVDMSGSLGLDFQFSDILRVKNSFQFTFPSYTFTVTEFFIDYNMFNRVYFRAGKTGVAWGQSRNYEFTNLPARIPRGNSGGDSIILKADIPVGIGGLQLLGLLRPGFIKKSTISGVTKDSTMPGIKEIAYGVKLNFAFRRLDTDLGLFFHEEMPLRSFISMKTTLANFELYADALYAYQHEGYYEYLDEKKLLALGDRHQGAFGFGMLRDFFDKKLTVNLEAFYNADKESTYWQKQGDFVKEAIVSYIDGWNSSINVVVKPVDYKSFRIFSRCLYSFETNSAWLVPGVSIAPLSHITTYLSVPMALGPRDGPYYTKNGDTRNRPFSIVLGVRVSGSYSFRHYE
jgi:hypothetical protein